MNTNEKRYLRFFYLSICLMIVGATCTRAQIAQQINIGLAMPKISNDYLGGSFASGYEIGYFGVAKYSEKLEWRSGFHFIHGEQKDVGAYKRVVVGGNDVAQSTTVGYTMNAFGFDYVLSYYIVPDFLALGGGGNLFLFFPGTWLTDDISRQYFLTEKNVNGKPMSSISDESTIGGVFSPGFFNISLEGSVHLMPTNWLQVYLKYNHFFGNAAEGDEGLILPEGYGSASINIIRAGLGFRLVGSNRDKRY